MIFADVHTHILSNVDDGAETEVEMYELLDECYKDDIRYLCCTPHYHPGYYGDNTASSEKAFELLDKYREEKYPDMKLLLGNELHYHPASIDWVKSGQCRTLNNTRYFLVDFSENESASTIEDALGKFLQLGYIPILAHIERYRCFRHHYRALVKFREAGVLLQVNASSIINMRQYPILTKLFKKYRIDLVASDAHNLRNRPPLMKAAYREICSKYGNTYASWIFYEHAVRILLNK